MDETKEIEILELLLREHPEAVRHVDNRGRIPILIASSVKTLDFCQSIWSMLTLDLRESVILLVFYLSYLHVTTILSL